MQESFMKLIGVLHQIEEIKSAKTRNFIYTITKNHAINKYKRRKRMFRNTIDLEEIESLPDTSSVQTVSDVDDLKELIHLMPEKYREILELVIVYGKNYKTLAKLISIKEDAVKKRFERAKKMLKMMLHEKGEDVDDL